MQCPGNTIEAMEPVVDDLRHGTSLNLVVWIEPPPQVAYVASVLQWLLQRHGISMRRYGPRTWKTDQEKWVHFFSADDAAARERVKDLHRVREFPES